MAKASTTELFSCSTDQFMELIKDYEKYPEFIDEVKSVKIVKSEGHKKWVDYCVAIIKTFNYTLETTEESPQLVTWTLAKGDLFKKLTGSWELQDEGGKCRATYTVDIDFGLFVPGPVVKTVQSVNLKMMMSSFQKRVRDVYGR